MDSRSQKDSLPDPTNTNAAFDGSPLEARPGRPGVPALWVLILSSVLAIAGLAFAFLGG